jgi:prepilin-type N-terminal cleavage/methylation domain-containing protein
MRYARRGFTLLELMIAIALMLVVMLMLRSMFVNAQEIYIRAARRVDVFAQGRAVLDSIERDLMKLVKGHDNETLTLRSLTPANWTNAELARQGDTYSSNSRAASPPSTRFAPLSRRSRRTPPIWQAGSPKAPAPKQA